jgi:hypothetical protein
MNKPDSEENNLILPRYSPGTPPKDYKEKKAISIFCCLWFSYGIRCPELLRATITTKGDIYVIPYVEYMGKSMEKFRDFHLSYHSSGDFRWAEGGTHVEPVCGETDFGAAFGMWLKVRRPACFCFRKGKGISDKEIVSLLQRLAQNFPFTFDVGEALQNLRRSNFYRLVSADLKQ